MSATGRRSDAVWSSFTEVKIEGRKGKRAKCKLCGKEMEGQVARMKKHYQTCNNNIEDESGDVEGKTNNYIIHLNKLPNSFFFILYVELQ